jgi:hypothetical protein
MQRQLKKIAILLAVTTIGGCDESGDAGAGATREERNPIVTPADRAKAAEWRGLMLDLEREGAIYKIEDDDDHNRIVYVTDAFYALPIDAKEGAAVMLFKLRRIDDPDCRQIEFRDHRSGKAVGEIDELGFDWEGE